MHEIKQVLIKLRMKVECRNQAVNGMEGEEIVDGVGVDEELVGGAQQHGGAEVGEREGDGAPEIGIAGRKPCARSPSPSPSPSTTNQMNVDSAFLFFSYHHHHHHHHQSINQSIN
jgi:hypothetical protein